MLTHNLQKYEKWILKRFDGNQEWRIGIYLRLSRADRRKLKKLLAEGKDISQIDSESIVNQLKSLGLFLFESLEDFIVMDIYIDDGRTGTDFERSDYQRMMRDVESNIINCILVKDLTRFVRNFADGLKELESFVLEKNIRFISSEEPFVDSLIDPHCITSPTVYDYLKSGEDVARITSMKIRRNQEVKRFYGESTGGFAPYGFIKEGKKYFIDKEVLAITNDIYLWSLQGMSDRQIAKKLNALGIPNPTKYKQQKGLAYYNPHAEDNKGLWSPTTVGRILTDRTYIGAIVQHKTASFDHKRHKQKAVPKSEQVVVEDCHEKAITKEIFDNVQELRKQRRRSTKKTGTAHIFANLVYCSDCKRAMKKTNAGKYEYLVCRTYKDAGRDFCTSRSIRFDVLEKIVLETIKSQMSLVIDMQSIIDDVNNLPEIKTKSSRLEKLVEEQRKEIDRTERLIDASYHDWKNEDISREQYQRIRKDSEEKLESIRNTLQKIYAEQQQLDNGIRATDNYFKHFLKYKNIEELNKLLLVELIDKIYINVDKTVHIDFKYNDQYKLIIDYINENHDEPNAKQKTLTIQK